MISAEMVLVKANIINIRILNSIIGYVLFVGLVK